MFTRDHNCPVRRFHSSFPRGRFRKSPWCRPDARRADTRGTSRAEDPQPHAFLSSCSHVTPVRIWYKHSSVCMVNKRVRLTNQDSAKNTVSQLQATQSNQAFKQCILTGCWWTRTTSRAGRPVLHTPAGKFNAVQARIGRTSPDTKPLATQANEPDVCILEGFRACHGKVQHVKSASRWLFLRSH